jgi:hypothetical protein
VDNSTFSDINNTTDSANTTSNTSNNNKIFKQIWQLGNKHFVIVDESIINKLGITENSTFFVEQELTKDSTTILMRIKKIQDL